MSTFMLMTLLSVVLWVAYFMTGAFFGVVAAKKIGLKKFYNLFVFIFALAWPVLITVCIVIISIKTLLPIMSSVFSSIIGAIEKNTPDI